MKTAQIPERTMANKTEALDSGGKLAVTLAEDQSSVRIEEAIRMGIARSSL